MFMRLLEKETTEGDARKEATPREQIIVMDSSGYYKNILDS